MAEPRLVRLILATFLLTSPSLRPASAEPFIDPLSVECISLYVAIDAGGTVAHLHSDLATYIRGMNKSSLQKAVYAALANSGIIVDMGAGSGITAYDISVLFPTSKVIGVDLDPNMVNHAGQTYRNPNLRYLKGNAQKQVFLDNSVDAIFMSSTGHHLTSYGEGKFDRQHVMEAFDNAVKQLKPDGLFIMRDFVIPEGPEWIHLDLPATD